MFVNYNSLVRYKVVSHCSFDLYLVKSGIECILMYLLGKTFCFEFGLLRLNYFTIFRLEGCGEKGVTWRKGERGGERKREELSGQGQFFHSSLHSLLGQ